MNSERISDRSGEKTLFIKLAYDLKFRFIMRTVTFMEEQILLEAKISNIYKLADFIDRHLSSLRVSPAEEMKIQMVCEELFVNIAHYAYAPNHGNCLVTVKTDEKENAIEIVLSDWGVPFNPLAKKDPDVTLPISQRKIGGLGIYLVKKEVNGVTYRREDGVNILWLKKRFRG